MRQILEIGWIIDREAEATLNKLRVDIAEANPIIISGRWSVNAAFQIACQAASSMEVVALSPFNSEAPKWIEAVELGANASFNPFKPIGNKDLYAYFISEVAKGALELTSAQALALRRALSRLYATSKEPTIDEVLSAVEVEAVDLRGEEANELIEAIEVMSRGRIGAACRGGGDINGSKVITMPRIPPTYASIITASIIYHIMYKGFNGLMMICGIESLQAMLNRAWKLLLNLMFEQARSKPLMILTSSSTAILPLDLRAKAGLLMTGTPMTPEDSRLIRELVGPSALKLLDNKNRYAYKLSWSSGVVEVEEEHLMPIEVEEELEAAHEAPKPMLYVKLGSKAKMAYEVLSFLRDGASTRDAVISYAMHRLDISSLEASRLINALLTHGLASEVVGADGKYWLKITVRGLNAIEEVEALEGWLA